MLAVNRKEVIYQDHGANEVDVLYVISATYWNGTKYEIGALDVLSGEQYISL